MYVTSKSGLSEQTFQLHSSILRRNSPVVKWDSLGAWLLLCFLSVAQLGFVCEQEASLDAQFDYKTRNLM